MARPSKPISVIVSDGKSHRTKAEIESRQKAEAALSSGQALKARTEVRENPIALKEYRRVSKLLANIGKNDALVEGSVNRYCQLTAEVADMEKLRDEFKKGIDELTRDYEADCQAHSDIDERIIPTMEYFQTLSKMQSSLINLDKQVMAKRKMLLDLEKENIMTIAAQLRSIPKKAEEAEEDDPMAELFAKMG